MKNIVLLILAVAFAANHALADDQSSGCGLGWEVSKKNSLVSSSIRATTNEFLPSTFSMTSGTSGCAKHSIVQHEMPSLHLVAGNRDTLRDEMAAGHGETLASLARTMGCKDSVTRHFGAVMQAHFDEIAPAQSPAQMYIGVRSAVQSDAALSSSCTI